MRWRTGGGGTVTVSRAGSLRSLPLLFWARTEYAPLSAGCTLVNVRLELVAPGIGMSCNNHWNVGAGEPLAVTVKVALAPGLTVALAGWDLISAPSPLQFHQSPQLADARGANTSASMAKIR